MGAFCWRGRGRRHVDRGRAVERAALGRIARSRALVISSLLFSRELRERVRHRPGGVTSTERLFLFARSRLRLPAPSAMRGATCGATTWRRPPAPRPSRTRAMRGAMNGGALGWSRVARWARLGSARLGTGSGLDREYPVSTGRNFYEIIRAIDTLQLTMRVLRRPYHITHARRDGRGSRSRANGRATTSHVTAARARRRVG